MNSVPVKALVLIEAAVGRTKEVTTLEQLEGMNSVDTVTCPDDIVAIVKEAMCH